MLLYRVFLGTGLALLLGLCQAMDTPDTTTQTPGEKRFITIEESGQDEPLAKRRQVFGRTTYDSTVKLVFEDNSVRLSFVNAFLEGIIPQKVQNVQPLSEFLTPLKPYTTIRELLNDYHTQQLMKDAAENPDNAVVCVKRGDRWQPYDPVHYGKRANFVSSLAKFYKDLLKLVPEPEKQAQVDMLCQIDDKEYILVEVQVAKEDYWDARSLAYASYTYSNQLKRGTPWAKLKSVIAINILGGGPKNVRHWAGEGKPYRHYKIVDIYDPRHTIPQLQILQFSLPDAELDDPQKVDAYIVNHPGIHHWLTYFKTAHLQEKIPDGVDPGLKKAYELATLEKMPSTIRLQYDMEDKYFSNFTEYTQTVREHAKAEGRAEGKAEGEQEAKLEIARNMLRTNLAMDVVASYTGLSEEILKTLTQTTTTTTSTLTLPNQG